MGVEVGLDFGANAICDLVGIGVDRGSVCQVDVHLGDVVSPLGCVLIGGGQADGGEDGLNAVWP